MALAWPAALAAPAVAAPVGLTVSPATVQAGQETTLLFTFTAPTPPPAQFLVVTLPVPAGWTAIPPSPADLSCQGSGCFLAASSTQTSVTMNLARSPVVTVALVSQRGQAGMNWLPIVLAVIGLVLVAGAAGLAAFRPLRRGLLPRGPESRGPESRGPESRGPESRGPVSRGPESRGPHGTAAGDVRAVPHAGPPPSVTIRDTGGRPALTVRIEPRAGTPVTTIKERQL